LFCIPFGVFAYPRAERVWLFFNIECLLFSSFLLRVVLKRLPRFVPPLALFAFLPTLIAVFAGQAAPLILLLVTASWCLLEERHDQSAGALLAGATIKPQLAFVLVAGVLLWSLRRRRWGVLGGFTVALGLLCLASTAVLPSWPLQMLRATRVTRLPTDLWPWVGVTWTLALRTLGLHGWVLGGAYSALAVPVFALVLAAAWDPVRPLRDVLALGAVAAFLVSPYAQLYDFPLLVIPLLVLLSDGLPKPGRALLLAVFLLIPYCQMVLLLNSEFLNINRNYIDKYIFVWIPILLAVSLIISGWTISSRCRGRPRWSSRARWSLSLFCSRGSSSGGPSARANGPMLISGPISPE
jgi:hypothetical protein